MAMAGIGGFKVQKRSSNCYYRILLTKDSVIVEDSLTCIGPDNGYHGDLDVSCFSPDGSKYISLGAYSGLRIFDFDRCTGTLSDPLYFPIPAIIDSQWYGYGVAISPNNRFLYVSVTKELYQFDLTDPDIFSHIDTVGYSDTLLRPFQGYLTVSQLAPDGKIYLESGNSVAFYNVINNPDLKGDSCNFAAHGLLLPTIIIGLPTYPNYRLGTLTGSPCDTLSTMTADLRAAKEKILKIFPNPASDFVFVDYGFTDWNKGQVSLEIDNALGQIVYIQQLPMYSGYQKLDVSKFASGVYQVAIKRQGGSERTPMEVVAVGKFVRE